MRPSLEVNRRREDKHKERESEKEREVDTRISSCPGPRALGFKVPVRADERRGINADHDDDELFTELSGSSRAVPCRLLSRMPARGPSTCRDTHTRARCSGRENRRVNEREREKKEKSQVRRREREREKNASKQTHERTNNRLNREKEQKAGHLLFLLFPCVCLLLCVVVVVAIIIIIVVVVFDALYHQQNITCLKRLRPAA